MQTDSDSVGPSECARARFIKDPIHDLIPISPLMKEFIDTKQFQRLRYVKQLGTTYYVWAGASHNRFEHSIGVAHLAGVLVKNLRQNQPHLKITDRDIDCVQIAGLCHDLGHGPWSHVWDGMFIPSVLPGSTWTHEQGSEAMFDYLIEDNGIEMDDDDIRFVKALIAGDRNKCSLTEKPFLFDIVANKRNGLDVDKYDYIQRDSYMLGDPMKLNIQRIVESARVIDKQICYDYKDLDKIFDVYHNRHKLHKNYYNHKTAKAIEYMIIDGLKLAEPYMQFAAHIYDSKRFLYLTDDMLMRTILMSESSELQPARAIFERIERRDLYKCVDKMWLTFDERDLYEKHITKSKIVELAHKEFAKLPPKEQLDIDIKAELTPDDVIVELTVLHYGMKARNPIESVKFYSKENPRACYTAGDRDYSTLRPLVFAETLLRVYTKKPEFFGIVQSGFRAIEIPPQVPSTSGEVVVNDSGALTPPATEVPSSPEGPSHQGSFSSPNNAKSPSLPASSIPKINRFTTVEPRYSPVKKTGRRSPRKRGRSEDQERDISPSPGPKKKRA